MNHVATSMLAGILNTLGYAAAVVLLLELALRALRGRISAAARCYLWFSVLVLLLLLPFLPGMTASLRTRLASAPVPAVLTHRAAAHDAVLLNGAPAPPLLIRQSPATLPWPLWLLSAWLFAALWQLANLVFALLATHRLKRNARALHSRRLAPQLATDNWQLTTSFLLLESPALTGPAAVGFLHPAVILPLGLLDGLQPEEREAVLLHEWAHIERGDHWAMLAERFLGALLVFHPLAAFVQHRIERERELACDDFVVAHTGAARVYARSLARLHELRFPVQPRLLAAGLWGRHSELGNRIESLLRRGRAFHARSGWTHAAASGALLVALLAGGGLLPRWIAFAQAPAAPGLPHYPTPDQPPGTPRLTFDVVSVQPGSPGNMGGGVQPTPGNQGYVASAPLGLDISVAWGIPARNIEGAPDWVRTQPWVIQAKSNRPQTFDDLHLMLEHALEDRFALKLHLEMRKQDVYFMQADARDAKLTPHQPADDASGPGETDAGKFTNIGMDFWAMNLTRRFGVPVLNRTGLTGAYDFTFQPPAPQPGVAGPPDPRPTFDALRAQLGLRFVRTKGAVEYLVIDSVSKPTPN